MQLNILNIEFAQGKFLDIFPSLHQGSQRSREDCEDGLLWIGKPRLQVLRCVAAGFMYSYAQESNISNVPKSKFQVSQSHTQYCNNIQQSKKSPKKKGHLSRKKISQKPNYSPCFHLHEVAEDSLPAAPEVPIALDKALEVRLGGTKEKSQLETLATEVESEKVGLIWIG